MILTACTKQTRPPEGRRLREVFFQGVTDGGGVSVGGWGVGDGSVVGCGVSVGDGSPTVGEDVGDGSGGVSVGDGNVGITGVVGSMVTSVAEGVGVGEPVGDGDGIGVRVGINGIVTIGIGGRGTYRI